MHSEWVTFTWGCFWESVIQRSLLCTLFSVFLRWPAIFFPSEQLHPKANSLGLGILVAHSKIVVGSSSSEAIQSEAAQKDNDLDVWHFRQGHATEWCIKIKAHRKGNSLSNRAKLSLALLERWDRNLSKQWEKSGLRGVYSLCTAMYVARCPQTP